MYPYQRIAADLRDRIIRGDIAPDQQLPTEHVLATEHNVSRETVRRGLALLQGEGLVAPDPPRGWFVRRREHMVYRPQYETRPYQLNGVKVEAWAGQITTEGRTPSQQIHVEIVAANQRIAERLEIPIGASVVARRRIRRINGSIVNLNDSYYPLSLVDGSRVMDPGDVPEGITHILAELGYVQTRAIDEIDVAMPTPEQRDRLQLSIGTPVAVHTVTSYTKDDQPVRCTVNVLPGDRHRIVYERGNQ